MKVTTRGSAENRRFSAVTLPTLDEGIRQLDLVRVGAQPGRMLVGLAHGVGGSAG
jgi:hypothetical protein